MLEFFKCAQLTYYSLNLQFFYIFTLVEAFFIESNWMEIDRIDRNVHEIDRIMLPSIHNYFYRLV